MTPPPAAQRTPARPAERTVDLVEVERRLEAHLLIARRIPTQR